MSIKISGPFFFFFFFIYGCVGSSFLCEGFLQLRQARATLHRGARASHYRGLSCCGAQAPDAQAQLLWLTGPVAPWHVGSSQTRARTRVPCIGRQTLNHCATREAPGPFLMFLFVCFFSYCQILRVLCIFWIGVFYQISSANIFTKSVACILILFIFTFIESKF